ncbi:acetolactate synthase AlsS [Lacticaseibacillus nasuensis]|uniref:acetolactate synthase AlsS n=1 Tax=Lacticaseibacillus nasuensis TaxID=944671 RepID=UPI001CDA7061|nr:acetolactate synthase AlsS [Lacticaseibacillus nasuensis]
MRQARRQLRLGAAGCHRCRSGVAADSPPHCAEAWPGQPGGHDLPGPRHQRGAAAGVAAGHARQRRTNHPRAARLVVRHRVASGRNLPSAGIVSRELEDNFFGRVGLFRNQPGDQLLKAADLVITIGYDPVEYEPRNWNAEGDARIIDIDSAPAEIDHNFQPETELIGDIEQTLDILTPLLRGYQVAPSAKHFLSELQAKLQQRDVPPVDADAKRSHPLAIVAELQQRVTDDMTVAVDVGSFYIWMARHFRSYQPRRLLFSNGMQTLGVALPWAIAATLVRPGEKAVSISGDGGFLFSGQELETAVRLHANLVHIIWNDGHYDMVKFQEEMKYGQSAGVNFGPVDFVKYAESFGAKGLRVNTPAELGAVLDEAFAADGPVVVDIPVDYSHNQALGQAMLPDQLV